MRSSRCFVRLIAVPVAAVTLPLTVAGSGPGNYDYELQQKYGEFGTTPEPPAMPSDGWKHFYKPCS
ncbi:hypothetical protein [Streptomyces decoyicus]|uniref:hypothetical protein n=1 Tax=Streptomyces decoyicus TaxID=249567 RepID=UPI000AEA3946|nr:hypothetical protein [Streptomyces decoyicus]